jgi:hypothetical protein
MGCFQIEGLILRCLVNVIIQRVDNSISVFVEIVRALVSLALTPTNKIDGVNNLPRKSIRFR